MRVNQVLVIIFLFYLVIAETQGQPATEQHGRGPDGRAYRIDKDGLRLVDQIAELEVTIDELNKRIFALENEIDEKDRKLGKLVKGSDHSEIITERDLLSEGPQPTLPGIIPAQQQTNCSPLLAPLQAKISQLEKEIETYNLDNQELKTKIALLSNNKDRLSYQNEVNSQKLDQEKEIAREQLSRQSQEYEEELQSARGQIIKTQNEMSDKNAEVLKLQEMLKAKEQQEQDLKKQTEYLSNKVASLESSIAVFEKEFTAQQKYSTVSKATRESSKTPSVVLGNEALYAQKELNNKLNSLQKLINDRKSLYDRLKESRSNVLVSVQPLKTENGESLDEIRRQISTVKSNEEEQEVLYKLGEIENILNEDLKLLKRLCRI